MDVQTILKPLVSLVGAVILSGAAVTLATELMKVDFIPIPAKKYPRTVAAIASILAALVSLANDQVALLVHSVWGILALAIAILVIAANAYQRLVKGSIINVSATSMEKGIGSQL